jgi:hypothetical protein
MTLPSAKRVRVRCKNEACGWGWDDSSPKQRSSTNPLDKPCLRCSCAVELAPGVVAGPVEVEPLPGTEAAVVAAQAPRSLFEGLRPSPLELSDACSVSIRTFRVLSGDPRVPNHVRAAQVLEEWAKRQPDPPGWPGQIN